MNLRSAIIIKIPNRWVSTERYWTLHRVYHVGQIRQQIFVAYSLKLIFMLSRQIWECVCRVEKRIWRFSVILRPNWRFEGAKTCYGQLQTNPRPGIEGTAFSLSEHTQAVWRLSTACEILLILGENLETILIIWKEIIYLISSGQSFRVRKLFLYIFIIWIK